MLSVYLWNPRLCSRPIHFSVFVPGILNKTPCPTTIFVTTPTKTIAVSTSQHDSQHNRIYCIVKESCWEVETAFVVVGVVCRRRLLSPVMFWRWHTRMTPMKYVGLFLITNSGKDSPTPKHSANPSDCASDFGTDNDQKRSLSISATFGQIWWNQPIKTLDIITRIWRPSDYFRVRLIWCKNTKPWQPLLCALSCVDVFDPKCRWSSAATDVSIIALLHIVYSCIGGTVSSPGPALALKLCWTHYWLFYNSILKSRLSWWGSFLCFAGVGVGIMSVELLLGVVETLMLLKLIYYFYWLFHDSTTISYFSFCATDLGLQRQIWWLGWGRCWSRWTSNWN